MKAVTFGEIMLRLAPEGYLRFLQEPRFQATFGGGEANVAVSLAQFGVDAAFVSKLPANDIAEACVRELKSFGVDCSGIARGGSRMGIYYLEKGASVRPSKVIYDRAHSAIAEAAFDDFDWEKIFDGADWFHFSGIAPALSENTAKITLDAVKAAKDAKVYVSCDLNYRKNLWDTKRAQSVMSGLMPYVDLCIGNEEDAEKVFGVKPDDNDVTGGELNKKGYEQVARKLTDMFGFDKVACTLRESISASDNKWGAMLYSQGKAVYSRTYPLHIVDRVGGGDSFSAGLIYALMSGMSDADALEFAVGASALKHTVEGNFNRVTVDEVKRLAGGDASGRVQR